jgi:hypothetical protein
LFDNTQLILLIIEESLLLFLLIGTCFTLLIGLFFLILPSHAIRFNQRLSSWTSMRKSTRALDLTHHAEPVVYRHYRFFGLFIMFGTTYVLYRLGFHYNHIELIKLSSETVYRQWFTDWMLSAFLWFCVPAMLLILLFGAVLAIRPSGLKRLEKHSNKWISTRRLMLPLEKQSFTTDNLVFKHPRWFGIIIMTSSASILISLLITYIRLFR